MPSPAPKQSWTYERSTSCGKLYTTVGEKTGKITYLSLHMGKPGGCSACFLDSLGRTIGRSLEFGIPPKKIISDLVGCRCHAPKTTDGVEILSCPDALGKILKEHIEAREEKK